MTPRFERSLVDKTRLTTRQCQLIHLAICLTLLATCCGFGQAHERLRVYDKLQEESAQKRLIRPSEFSLRNSVEQTNVELRQLKRDFVQQMSDLYVGFRLHPAIGYERAHKAKLFVASANILMAEQFAEMAIKKHIIQRRLWTGLKAAYIKLLPSETLVNLYKRHQDTFAWLRYQQQVDVRPKFEGLKEEAFSDLYELIGLRARVRAADDVLALTSDNAQRILQTLQHYLVDHKGDSKVTDSSELRALASHAKQVLVYYLDEVVGWNERLHELYDSKLEQAKDLQLAVANLDSTNNQQNSLVSFLDRLINVEALDIGLNQEANRLEYPPTISESMINKLLTSWIPNYVLESVQADRKLLVANRKRILDLVKLQDKADEELDLAKWALEVYRRLC